MDLKERMFNKVRPPSIGNLLMIIFGIAGYYYGRIIFYPYNLIGIIPAVLGFYLMMSASFLFFRNKTGVTPRDDTTKFIVSSYYKYTRNPMYLGLVVMYTGISVIIGSPICFLAPVLYFFILNTVWIPLEEKKMQELFKQSYVDYKSRVRRWV